MERWSEGIIVRLFSNLIGTRFIGKRYEHGPNWGEWWQNEWCADGGSVSPWFLGEPFTSIDEFARFVRMLRMMLEQAKARNICKVLLAA